MKDYENGKEEIDNCKMKINEVLKNNEKISLMESVSKLIDLYDKNQSKLKFMQQSFIKNDAINGDKNIVHNKINKNRMSGKGNKLKKYEKNSFENQIQELHKTLKNIKNN